MDALDVRLAICEKIRADPVLGKTINLYGKTKAELEQAVIPRRYDRSTLDGETVKVSVFDAQGTSADYNTSAILAAVQVEILTAEEHSVSADKAKRRIREMLDGSHICGYRMRALPDPGSLVAATGFYRTAIRFRFNTYIKN